MEKKPFVWFLLLLISAAIVLAGCTNETGNGEQDNNLTLDPNATQAQSARPSIPEKLTQNDQGIPVLAVYQVDEDATQEMDIETYLLGVLAGEMKNDWPMEALKAQAILARTFVLKFASEKTSKYAGADISTDIEEAQAYDATGVNERIEQAVEETCGLVLSYQGMLPYAWFHAHSGGVTAGAKEGLAYAKGEPGYTKIVAGKDSEEAPTDAREWKTTFSKQEVLAAAQKAGLDGIKDVESISVAERGESGRATVLSINGQTISAPELRIALGSSKMRSTLLTSLRLEGDWIIMAGKGYGHGVGMPQWGAYALAEQGMDAAAIVTYYFQDVSVEKIW